VMDLPSVQKEKKSIVLLLLLHLLLYRKVRLRLTHTHMYIAMHNRFIGCLPLKRIASNIMLPLTNTNKLKFIKQQIMISLTKIFTKVDCVCSLIHQEHLTIYAGRKYSFVCAACTFQFIDLHRSYLRDR
jgi:hypothetical protein